jgi:nucleoside-diphosphate-sugar epimerase
VTGAGGRAGRVVVEELVRHGHEVRATDVVAAPDGPGVPLLRADLTDYGQAVEALAGTDAVVHLANIPAPELFTPAETFNRNTAMNFNVFHAAAHLRLDRVVWASSETTLGLPFDVPPRYAPIDEDHFPYPTTTYALSKVAAETLAEHVSAWSGIPFVALRLSTSSARATTRSSPPTGAIRGCAAGTCGAISTPGTPRPPAGSPWTRRCRAARATSSPPPTP